VDLAPPQGEIFIHYGSPLVTAANTVIVPVKTTTGFRVEGHNGATGQKMWTQATKYQVPGAAFLPGIGPTLSGKLFPDFAERMVPTRPEPGTATSSGRKITPIPQSSANVQINTPDDGRKRRPYWFPSAGPRPSGYKRGWRESPQRYCHLGFGHIDQRGCQRNQRGHELRARALERREHVVHRDHQCQCGIRLSGRAQQHDACSYQ
jgi:hypothetical protein